MILGFYKSFTTGEVVFYNYTISKYNRLIQNGYLLI